MESKKNYGVVVNYHVEELKHFIDEYTDNWHTSPTHKLKAYLMGAIDFVNMTSKLTGREYMELKDYARKKVEVYDKIKRHTPTDITEL